MEQVEPRFAPRARLRTEAGLHLALDPVRETQATFRAALDALAWPGRVGRLPVAARGAPGNPWAVALLLTFLDHETSLAVEPGPESAADAGAVAAFVRRRTNAAAAPAEAADYVLADAAALDPELPMRLRLGSVAYPDDSATLPSLASTAGGGLRLDLAGPGVPAGHALRLDGLAAAFVAARNRAVRAYPRGIDLFLIDREGRLAALPRSTTVRVAGIEEAG